MQAILQRFNQTEKFYCKSFQSWNRILMISNEDIWFSLSVKDTEHILFYKIRVPYCWTIYYIEFEQIIQQKAPDFYAATFSINLEDEGMDHFINNLVLTYYCLSFTHISHKRHGTTLVRKSWHAPIQITMETTRHYSRTRRLLQESESKYDWWSIWRHRHDGIFCKKAERSLDHW